MSLFKKIHINSAELEYVIGLSSADRIQYLFEIYDLERAKNQNPNLNLKERLVSYECSIIKQALEECDGNKTQAARRLGFTLRTLRNKIKKCKL